MSLVRRSQPDTPARAGAAHGPHRDHDRPHRARGVRCLVARQRTGNRTLGHPSLPRDQPPRLRRRCRADAGLQAVPATGHRCRGGAWCRLRLAEQPERDPDRRGRSVSGARVDPCPCREGGRLAGPSLRGHPERDPPAGPSARHEFPLGPHVHSGRGRGGADPVPLPEERPRPPWPTRSSWGGRVSTSASITRWTSSPGQDLASSPEDSCSRLSVRPGPSADHAAAPLTVDT